MSEKRLHKIILSAIFLTLGLVLPFLTGQIPEIGSMLLPMHIPVLICGFLCGWQYGLIIGFITPLLRSLLFSSPPFMPVAVSMAFELAAYGAFAALLYRHLKKYRLGVLISLAGAMLIGRLIWALVRLLLTTVTDSAFTWAIFIAGAFINALPGIILQFVLIPPIILLFEKTKVNKNGKDY